MLEMKNLSASNTFATGIRKTSILTREVLQKQKCDAHRGRQAQKSEWHRGWERHFCVSQHPLGENGNMLEKCTLALEWRTGAVCNSHERKQESSPRVGERAIEHLEHLICSWR